MQSSGKREKSERTICKCNDNRLFPTGYVNKKTAKAKIGKSFAGIATQKVAGDDKEKIQEKPSKVLGLIGAHAPDEVRQAWAEAEKEMGGWLQYTGFPTRRIIKKKTVQENHFHNVLCLSEAKGMDISMKKVYIFSMFLFIFCLTGCQKINSEDEGVKQEQDIVEKITEAEDLDVIGETESSAAYVNEAERKESTEEDVTEISVTWQDAYKNIIRNIQSNLADPYNFMSDFGFSGWAYVGIHDFDNNNIPELIIGSAESVAVFTYEEGKAEKVADLYETEDWGGINYLCYKDNHLVLMSCGNGENADNGYVCFTYEQGEYVTGFYDDYQPDKATINGEPVSKEEFPLQFDVLKLKENNHIEFDWENSTIEYCKVNDEDEIMLADSDEWIAIDDLDFSLIEW